MRFSFCPANSTTTGNLFPQNMSASFTQHKMTDEMNFTNVVPTVSGSASVPATSLPDPSTFFDTIGPEPQIVPTKSGLTNPLVLTEAMDGLSIKVSVLIDTSLQIVLFNKTTKLLRVWRKTIMPLTLPNSQ